MFSGRTICLGIAVCLAALAQAQQPLQGMVPWVYYSPGQPEPYDYWTLKQGLHNWKDIAPTMIVEVGCDNWRPIFTDLLHDVHDVQVIPGLDVYSGLLGDADNYNGWQTVADAVAGATALTGSHYVLLDLETSWWSYSTQTGTDAALVEADLLAGLDLLPKDRHYIWYPAIGIDGDEGIRQQRFIAQVCGVLPEATFVTFDWAWTTDPASDWMQGIQGWNEATVGSANVASIVYYYRTPPYDQYSWRPEDIRYIMDNQPHDFFLVYPGAASFRRVGQLLQDALGH